MKDLSTFRPGSSNFSSKEFIRPFFEGLFYFYDAQLFLSHAEWRDLWWENGGKRTDSWWEIFFQKGSELIYFLFSGEIIFVS